MPSFLLALLILFVVMALANTVFKAPIKETTKVESVKEVNVLKVGQAPQVQVQAQVQKDGVIVITALTPGVVSEIHFREGAEVKRGQTLISLSSNYQGGNAASIQTALAQKQYQNTLDTFDTQMDLIKKQRDIASQTDRNSDDLRTITSESLEDTRDLLDLNEDILSSVNSTLNNLEQNNPGGINDATILQTKQAKAQLQSGILMLRSQLKGSEYSTDMEKAPTKLADLGRELTMKQLDVQEKALVLGKEVARLQVALAAVSEAMMFPSAPCASTVQKVHVTKNQVVNPGTPLVTLYAPSGNVKLEAKVTSNIAKSLNILESSSVDIGGTNVMLTPDFVSTQATDGQLYSVLYQVPEELQDSLTQGEFVNVTVPIGASSSAAISFVPLDAVYQTNSGSYLYVIEGDKAVSKKVTLGEVLGSDVAITNGLKRGDEVILNRNVIEGDKVKKS